MLLQSNNDVIATSTEGCCVCSVFPPSFRVKVAACLLMQACFGKKFFHVSQKIMIFIKEEKFKVVRVERKVDSKHNGKFYMVSRNLDFLRQISYLKEIFITTKFSFS